ncbi:hypothetical protein JTE90_005424 [Oedothorax gibbosus]|uniref:Uncharacterized protein n=1 Tax=Oedothorax gibbosus TaxID=931172 RepID=A0AAV6UR01_9ARAC|nr:hypothetical protein JTE90_005424 [Oedothorax gibbosus]
MAVNDGLHSMLSSIYSIIENVLNSDHAIEPVQESDSAQVVHCSKSRILEAFNRRRANLPICEQTEVYVTNMNPYQEITITNKDYDGKRKRLSSVAKKTQAMDVENHPNDFRSNEDICSSSPGTSQSSSPSLVSSDTGNESEYQSCKTLNGSVEQEENIPNICVEDESANMNTILESSTDEETSIEADQSINSSFLEVLQSKIKLTSQTLQKAISNIKNPPTNVYGLKDLESMDIKKSSSADETNSPLEISAYRKQFLEETARLYENFQQNYNHRTKDTNLRATPNERGLKRSTEACISNGNEPTLEDGSSARTNSLPICHPVSSPWQVNESQHKQNLPSIIISDHSSCQTESDYPGIAHLSDPKPASKTPATKRINSYLLPLSLQKDRWIEVGGFEQQSKIEDSKKLYENKELLERKTSIPSEKIDVSQSLVSDDTSSSDDSNDVGDVLAFDWRLAFLNLSNHPFNNKRSNFLDESDFVSLERVALLKKILQDVGTAEVLEDLKVDEHEPQKCTLSFLSKAENLYPEKCAVEELKTVSVPMQTDLLDVDHIPLMELDTEEKQITYLNHLTENYRKRLQIIPCNQKYIGKQENELLGNLEKRHKIMLDTIANGYTNQLDSITRNAGMCRNELCSIDTDLKTIVGVSKFKQEASNSANCLQIISPQRSTSEKENHESILPMFLTNSAAEPLKLKENEKISATLSTNKDDLLDTEYNSRTTFTLDSARTETSTPIKDEKIDDPSWVSINLSSGSHDEQSVNECKDIISSMYYPKFRRNILFNDLDLLDSKQEIQPSEDVKNISLEAEDWKNLAAQMSKNYEDVVSLLDSIDDSEVMKKESNSAENEDCNIIPGMVLNEKTFIEVLNCDSVGKAHIEQPTNEQSNKELEEETIPCNNREFNNASPAITNNKIINQDLVNAVLVCLQKENFVTEDKMLEDQMKINNYLESYLNSTDKDMEETKLQLLYLAADSYEKFVNPKSKSSCTEIGKSTPISNMEDLVKREELETIRIYDDFQVCDKVENCSNLVNLSEDDSNHNSGSGSEATMLRIEEMTFKVFS